MKILEAEQIEVIEKHPELFVEEAKLGDVEKALHREKNFSEVILLAMAKVCGYPVYIRYYYNKDNTLLMIDLTAKDPGGEFRLQSLAMTKEVVVKRLKAGIQKIETMVKDQLIKYYEKPIYKALIEGAPIFDSKGKYYG